MTEEARPSEPGQADTPEQAKDDQTLVVASQVYPEQLPIIPLPTRPVFPKTVAPLLLTQKHQLAMVRAALEKQERDVAIACPRGTADRTLAAGARGVGVRPVRHELSRDFRVAIEIGRAHV